MSHNLRVDDIVEHIDKPYLDCRRIIAVGEDWIWLDFQQSQLDNGEVPTKLPAKNYRVIQSELSLYELITAMITNSPYQISRDHPYHVEGDHQGQMAVPLVRSNDDGPKSCFNLWLEIEELDSDEIKDQQEETL